MQITKRMGEMITDQSQVVKLMPKFGLKRGRHLAVNYEFGKGSRTRGNYYQSGMVSIVTFTRNYVSEIKYQRGKAKTIPI